MADKKSFKLYKDSLCILDELNNEQAGVFIKAIKQYQETRTLPELDLLLRVVIKPFLLQFDRDDDAYEVVCEINKVNGGKGGRPKKTEKTESVKNNPTKPNETEINRTEPKKADTDTDTDTDTHTDTENDTSVSESAHALIKFIKDKCPQVAKMKYPLTLEESERLVNDYSKTDIAKLFNEMDNWGDLKKKTSANKTFRSWAQRGSVKKITEQHTHTPKLVNVNLTAQLVIELNNKFGLPLDWNEYDDYNRVSFIKKTPSIRPYFDLRGLGI